MWMISADQVQIGPGVAETSALFRMRRVESGRADGVEVETRRDEVCLFDERKEQEAQSVAERGQVDQGGVPRLGDGGWRASF